TAGPRDDLWPMPWAMEQAYLEAPDVALDVLRSALAEAFYLAERVDYTGSTSAGWAVVASWLTYASQHTPGGADDLAARFLARIAYAATEHAGAIMAAHLEATGRP